LCERKNNPALGMEYDAKDGKEMESVKARFTTIWIDVRPSHRLMLLHWKNGTNLLFLKTT